MVYPESDLIVVMKILPTLLLTAGLVCAEVPNRPTLTRYSQLWRDSPFTSKPVRETAVRDVDNPLDDYVLGGISKLQDGYYAVLINKKKPDEPKVIKPGGTTDYEVLSVDWDAKNWKNTIATVRSGRYQAQIGFDEEVLAKTNTPPPAPLKPPNLQLPNVPGLRQPANNANNQGRARRPRPRVVRPPKPAAGK